MLDPLAPSTDAAEVWERLDARPPTALVVLKSDHIRDIDVFVRRYHARALGPRLFFRDDVPETELELIEPGSHLPGGIVALYGGAATKRRCGCVARVARASVEHVIVSHGPVHSRAAYERALELAPWSG